MTEAQIRYVQAREAQRHNYAQEHTWAEQLHETERSNLAREELTRYQTDVQAQTARYAADKSAETQRYVSDQSMTTQLATAAMSASTSRYATDQNVAANTYRTDIESQDRQARLEFEKKTQDFKNDLESKRYTLEEMMTNARVEQSQAQIAKMTSDIVIATEQLALNARDVGNRELATKYENAHKVAQIIESGTRTMKDAVATTGNLIKLIVSLGAM